MATTTEIAWGDGSDDKIYLTTDALEGDQTVLVSSDANTGAARTKTVNFSASGVSPVTLTIVQAAGSVQPVFYSCLIFDGTAYIDTDVLMPENGSIRFTTGYETEKKYQVLLNFGGRVYAYFNNSTNSANRYFSSAYDSGTTQVSGTTFATGWTYISYSFFLTPKRIGVGSSSTTFTKGSSRPESGLVVGMNAAHTGTAFTGAINGYIRIYGSDAQNATSYSDLGNYTPVATLRPCTYAGEAGLWHVEEGVFYGNSAGAGTLIAANAINNTPPSSYDTTNKSYYSLSNVSNAYTDSSSTSYATIQLTRGSGAETYIYFKFDTSSIPQNATIRKVVCNCKCSINNTTSSNVATRQIQMYSGTTAKGTASTVASNTDGIIMDCGTWTREEINDVRVRLYAKRGTSNVNTNYYFWFYGATLKVFYT